MGKSRKSRTGAALASALLYLAAPAWAQVIEKEQVDTALTGKITAVDLDAKTVALEGANGESAVVGVGDATTIMSQNAKIGLGDLHQGAWVAVDADRKGDALVATYIEVVEDSAPDVAAGPEKKGAAATAEETAQELKGNVEKSAGTLRDTYDKDRAAGEGVVESASDAYNEVLEEGK